MNFFFQFVVVLLIVTFLHFINQLLLMKKNDYQIHWKSMTILLTISLIVTVLLNVSAHSMEYR
ncbi:hypothetical protein ACIQ1H_12475 [Lysinibacillus sp. NPDC097279]|uniref:hypothetical protein n=1 Tax=Lysinibacillus sp. NPDC097279 TaxID=3364143 RepID=UPI003815238F